MMLEIKGVHTFYGLSHILFDVSLSIHERETAVLLGRNGAGKTTTLRSIMGLAPPRSGEILFRGQAITGKPANLIAQMGIGFVPEDRRIFPTLTVWENLDVARKQKESERNRWDFGQVYELFPVLKGRQKQLGGTLSGGEQQMLTIARTLMGNPELLLLDEPSEGLAPLVVQNLAEQIRKLKAEGLAILLCEQNTLFSFPLSERAYIIEKGGIRFSVFG
ncbi:MAG: ABC transporter ATP-binding protein [Syntrophales bacterium LBB04]|nr:ABC transporter ATP-binding protein [Syntrophales bacterium LBB04]